MRKKKITVALFAGRYEGKVTSISEIILGLDENRFDTMFIYLSGYGDDGNLTEKIGRRFFYLSDRKQIKTFKLSILRKLARILKEQKVDIIHSQSHKCTVYATLAAMIARTPVVLAHVHGLGRSRGLRRKLVNLLLFRRINRLIAVANKVKEDVLRSNWFLSEDKLFVLENSVDYDRFAHVSAEREETRAELGLASNAFVYGTIARFGPYKGHSFLIEAFKKVQNRLSLAHLLLVGEGPLKEQLQREVVTAGLNQSVHFLGHRNDVPRLLVAMDGFVLPSIGSEGMPRVILEAMAAGIPCIATDVGGNREVIPDSSVGLLVPPKDADALANAMVTLARTSAEGLERYVEKARQRVHLQYCHDVVKAKLAGLYEEEYATVQQRGR